MQWIECLIASTHYGRQNKVREPHFVPIIPMVVGRNIQLSWQDYHSRCRIPNECSPKRSSQTYGDLVGEITV